MAIPRILGSTATLCVVAITFLGSFSRFTHGRFTPGFYQYQLARAPDDHTTKFVPYMDLLLAILALVPVTQRISLVFCTAFAILGATLRVQQGKDATFDMCLVVITVVALWAAVTRNHKTK